MFQDMPSLECIVNVGWVPRLSLQLWPCSHLWRRGKWLSATASKGAFVSKIKTGVNMDWGTVQRLTGYFLFWWQHDIFRKRSPVTAFFWHPYYVAWGASHSNSWREMNNIEAGLCRWEAGASRPHKERWWSIDITTGIDFTWCDPTNLRIVTNSFTSLQRTASSGMPNLLL